MRHVTVRILSAALLLSVVSPAMGAHDSVWKSGLDSASVVQIETALRRGEAKAKGCWDAVPGSAKNGPVVLNVVIDGSKGRITEATLRAPYAGTDIAGCLRRAFIGEIVLPFDGAPRNAVVTFDPPA